MAFRVERFVPTLVVGPSLFPTYPGGTSVPRLPLSRSILLPTLPFPRIAVYGWHPVLVVPVNPE